MSLHHMPPVDAVPMGMSTHALSNIAGTVEDSANGAAITISSNGASFIGEPSETVVENTMRETAGIGRACQFIIGDLINHAAGRWGEKYERWMEATGLDYSTLTTMASVCRKIPQERRRVELSFTHHKAVSALPEDGQERWLEEAKDRGMSVKRLEKSVELGRPATQDDLKRLKHKPDSGGNGEAGEGGSTSGSHTEEPPPIETVHPWVNRLSAHLGKMENSGELDGLTPDQLFNLHRDLMPILTKHGRIINRLFRIAPDAIKAEVGADMKKALGH